MGYLQDRDKRIAGFEETLELCEQETGLVRAILRSRIRTRCYHYEDGVTWERKLRKRISKDMAFAWLGRRDGQAERRNISVTQERSLEAVRRMRTAYPKSRIAVLHFASGTNPGGGVIRGGVGQEESLCRCSTLYPCLQSHKVRKEFYKEHQRTGNPYYSDTCVYLPGIVGFREDVSGGRLLGGKDQYMFDVITCAPPNVRVRGWVECHEKQEFSAACSENIQNVIEGRVRAILRTAIRNRVDILVLGAFGCGIYGNCAQVVANAFKKALKECGHSFKAVVFAIYSESDENYNIFSATLNDF